MLGLVTQTSVYHWSLEGNKLSSLALLFRSFLVDKLRFAFYQFLFHGFLDDSVIFLFVL